jgi:hypothetical protein
MQLSYDANKRYIKKASAELKICKILDDTTCSVILAARYFISLDTYYFPNRLLVANDAYRRRCEVRKDFAIHT